jgi:hypothetical protein
VGRVQELEAELDRAMGNLARHAQAGHTARVCFHKYYNRTRKLEAAIKRHARRECDCKSANECLTKLVALTPVKPRPTLRGLYR